MKYLAFSLFLVSSFVLPEANAFEIEIWQRPKGNFERVENPKKMSAKKIAIPKEQIKKLKLSDVQYGREQQYKVVDLSAFLLQNRPSEKTDLALLHFNNGMIIPWGGEEWKLAKSDQSLNLFLATEFRPIGEPKWKTKFPSVPRSDKRFRDPSPIKFSDNKLVVGTGLLSTNVKTASKGNVFSPFRHTSSLTGIEFVAKAAYEKQFQVKGADLAGVTVFLNRCAFCHSIKQVGARYGWDFVIPLPIYKKRSVESLFSHVKHKKQDAIQMGMHMPHQPDFNLDEAKSLWGYLKQVTNKKLRDYRP